MSEISQARNLLKQYFGFDKFRPMQDEIIQAVINKQDCLVLMPTGGGKSITFQIPALIQEGITIVISPLISLMKDQVDSLRANGINAAFINSSNTESRQKEIIDDINNNKLRIIYMSPERLANEKFVEYLKGINISLFAIDEAHCISQWGHDFRPEYTKLKLIKENFKNTPVIALTATADKITARDIIKQLNLENPQKFISSFDRPNLRLKVLPGRKRKEKIYEFIKSKPNDSGIIYCLSRKSTEELAENLTAQGIKAAAYHAGLSTKERTKIQDDFINDNIPVICATIAFGMGIDKSNVRWVIHYNMPKNIENYYQEIGRAGRDGVKSETLMFYSYSDVIVYMGFIEKSPNNKEVELAKLNRMQEYAESLTCRRKILLSYFGEHLAEDCGNCDVCENPPQQYDGTVQVQKALSAIYRLNENVGINMLISVLRGSRREEIVEKGYDKIKTFGAGKDTGFDDWQQIIIQMLNQGLIEIAYDKNHVLNLTEAANDVLFNNKKIKLVKSSELKKKIDEQAFEAKPASKSKMLKDDLFERLRTLRKTIAQQENVPPYVIFNDATLEEMCQKTPANIDELMTISGVGKHKCDVYGNVFIREIVNFILEKSEQSSKIKGSTYIITHELYKQGFSVDEIARQRKLSPTTIFSHLANSYLKGDEIDIFRLVSIEEIQKVEAVVNKNPSFDGLKTIFLELNEEIDYGKIRLALTYLKKNKA